MLRHAMRAAAVPCPELVPRFAEASATAQQGQGPPTEPNSGHRPIRPRPIRRPNIPDSTAQRSRRPLTVPPPNSPALVQTPSANRRAARSGSFTRAECLETLPVRVQRQTENAGSVANALTGHKKITRLIYPGRSDHPQADIIKKQMRAGSTLCSFEVKGGKEGAFRFLNGLQLIGITNNLGDAKSLVTHPTTTTHQRLTPDQRAELGIGDGLIRFSAGLEHSDDLIEDLLTALEKV